VFHAPRVPFTPPWESIFTTVSAVAKPLATDFSRGLPPRQDPEFRVARTSETL
jgi:hypothetical protein